MIVYKRHKRRKAIAAMIREAILAYYETANMKKDNKYDG